jgi:peptidoglycan/LPS O-acetylase OafA/YrhL
MAFLFAVALIASRSTFFSIELDKEGSSRLAPLDGLRGVLALSVFFHHSMITYFYYTTGQWQIPPSGFYTLLGQLSVPLFFMITGFLFWSKILESEIDIKKFFLRRIQRIVPLYIFTTLSVILIVLIASDFNLHSDFKSLLIQVIRWFSFTFLGTPDINGFKDTFTIESVYWTLKWEWIFYFSLPILAFFRKKSFAMLTVLLLISTYLGNIFLFIFTLGMLAAFILKFEKLNPILGKVEFFIGATIAFITLFIFFDEGYGFLQSLILFIFFLSVLHGNSLFGLLKTRAMRLLGMISYSIYLIHNIVLWIMFNRWNSFEPIQTISPETFWLIVVFSGAIVVLFSLITFRYIEHFFYHASYTFNILKKREL